MQISTFTPNNNTNKPAFGIKIDGKVAMKICDEMYGQKLTKHMPAYEKQFDKLSVSGLDSSELYLATGRDYDTFMLKNPEITTAYEKPIAQAKKGDLLSAWFKIQPEDIEKAEKILKEVIEEKRKGLVAMADNVIVRALLYTKNNEKDVIKAVQKMDDDTVIDLYYTAKSKIAGK